MRFSPTFKCSTHCLPSPDGALVAALYHNSIVVRTVESLEIVRTIQLSAELAASVTSFVWSSSSQRVLLTSLDEVHVFSVVEDGYHATIRNPLTSVAKAAYVDFGATDDEACVFSAFGIKLSIFNISTSKAVEVTSPKFYTVSSASRGFCFRPRTNHLALLTRISGKDTISIHSPGTREVQRSWSPDVIDAQGIAWTPDGRWLVVWESPAYGPRVLFFTPDGHLYKDWSGTRMQVSENTDPRLGAGVKLVSFSPNSQYVIIADHTRCMYLLSISTMTEQMQLRHPASIVPRDTIQVWQEQTAANDSTASAPMFVRASQPLSPPGRSGASGHELKAGCISAAFDCSSTLIATILEEAPSTIWVWDVAAAELRAVLMFYANVSVVSWHPMQPELLMIKCDGQDCDGPVFVWDPLSEGPRTINFASQLPAQTMPGKTSALWLKSRLEPPVLFFADNTAFVLASLADADSDILPWPERPISHAQSAGSTYQLEKLPVEKSDSDMDEDMSELDDTFRFKRHIR